jgi:AcrR family transcriptional regulator
MGTTQLPVQRPTRADAARNYDRLVAAAREAFAELGTDASLEDIARRAGVGIGTLYRRFPTRVALLEAAYVGEIQAVCDRAYQYAQDLPPAEALNMWFRSFVGYGISKKSLSRELVEALGRESEFFKPCKRAVHEAGQTLLDNAKKSGDVREDVELADVMRLIGGVTMHGDLEPEQAHRLIDIILAGIRP